ELIWCKIYVQNRERNDSADINHILLKYGKNVNWELLLQRLDPHWHLLLAQLLTFQFVYPSDYRDIIPKCLFDQLIERAQEQYKGMAKRKKTKIGVMVELDIYNNGKVILQATFERINVEAKVLLICGDLTDTGDEDEDKILGEGLAELQVPVVGVLGNYDYEKGRHKIIKQILMDHGMIILDGEAAVVENVAFAGVKGFGGGFE